MSVPPTRPPTGIAPPPFAVHVDLVAGAVRLDGVLTRRTVHLFADAVRTLQAADRPEWVIDVGALQSCDAAGLRALGVAYRRALVRGRTVVVHGASPWLCRALAHIRLDSHVLAGPTGRG